VVALDTETLKIRAIGKEAKEYIGRTPDRIQAVRPLKDGVIADFEVTKTMISYFIKKTLTGLQLIKPKMVICVPTGITQVEKRAVIESAHQAGAREVRLIEEPMAAAIGANLPIEQPLGNMVVDIGGGTTEVAVISLSSVAYSESVRIAGDEMNEAIQRYVQDKFQLLIGENAAEKVKIQIGSAYPLPEPLTTNISGKSLLDGRPKTIEIDDSQVRESIKEPVQAIVLAVRKALEKTPAELIGDVANNGILLAGGGALLKGLDILLKEQSGISVIIDDEPLTTVLRGTGKSLENKKSFEQMFVN
jgi:rod shape-determining protein MreB